MTTTTNTKAAAIVQVEVVDSEGRARRTTAQTTACPFLVVVPSVGDRGFTGGFTAAHIPTGRVLPMLELIGHEAGPAAVARAVAAVADLDWSPTDHEHYITHRIYLLQWARALRELVDRGVDLYDADELDETDDDADELARLRGGAR